MGWIDNLGFLAQAAQKTGPQVSISDLMAMKNQQAADEERRYQRERQMKEDRMMDTPVEVPGVSFQTQRPTQPSDIAGIVNQGRASVGLPGMPDIEAVAGRQRGGLGQMREQTEVIPSRQVSPRQAAVEKSVQPDMKARLTEAYMAGKIPDAARATVERLIGAKPEANQPNEWSTYLDAAGGDPKAALALRQKDLAATAGARSSGGDALIRHAQYFVKIGLAKDEQEAVRMLQESKTMSRDQFLMSSQKALLGNPFMEPSDRQQAMDEAASWYDQTIAAPAPQAGGAPGTSFIFRDGQLVPSTGGAPATSAPQPTGPAPAASPAPRTPLGPSTQGILRVMPRDWN